MLSISMLDILFVTFGLLFPLWPLVLVRLLDTRGDPFHSLAALCLILASVRTFIAFDPHPMLLFSLVPEPANTLLFLATGAGLLVIWFMVRERRMRSLSLIGLVVLVVVVALGSMLMRSRVGTSSAPFVLVGQPAAIALSTTPVAPVSYARGEMVALPDSTLVVMGCVVRTCAIWIRLPQASSKMAGVTGPKGVGSMLKETPLTALHNNHRQRQKTKGLPVYRYFT